MESLGGDIRSPLAPDEQSPEDPPRQDGEHDDGHDDDWEKCEVMGINHRRSSMVLDPRGSLHPKPQVRNIPLRYLVSILIGIGFGILLNVVSASDGVVTIVTLPGELFLRALQCAVIPMMFFNMIASVADIFGSGNASQIGKLAMGLYTLSTVLAALQGIMIAIVFAYLLDSDKGLEDDDDGVEVEMACPEDQGVLTVLADGSTACLRDGELSAYNVSGSYQDFHLRDVDSMLVNGVVLRQSLIDQIQTTTFSLFPNNAMEAFSTPNIISVIIIGCCVGGAVVHLQKTPRAAKGVDNVLHFCKEMSDITNVIIEGIITAAPFCIGFLIANSLASAGNILDLMRTVGVYVLSVLTGLLLHVGVTLPAVFYWFTEGENPYSWMYKIRHPVMVALSTASSAATLPVSIKTAVDSGLVEEQTANTLLPMGATINMDGAAIGYPCAISFLAHAAKLEGKLGVATWVNVGLASSLGSAGAAPVPNAGIVMLITVWETALPGYSVPDVIAYIQGIDFFTDRFQTATNRHEKESHAPSNIFQFLYGLHAAEVDRKKAVLNYKNLMEEQKEAE